MTQNSARNLLGKCVYGGSLDIPLCNHFSMMKGKSSFQISAGHVKFVQHWGQILVRNPDKTLRVFLLAIQSHLYSFALRFLFLQTHATSYNFYSTRKRRNEEDLIERHPLPFGLRNPYRNIKSENSQDYVQKPQRNCIFMNLASGVDCRVELYTNSLKSPSPTKENTCVFIVTIVKFQKVCLNIPSVS